MELKEVINAADSLAQKIALLYEGRISELEQDNERILQEVHSSRLRLEALVQERASEVVPRPKPHRHTTDDPQPVLCFDFDGTLKPNPHASFPLDDIEPFPGVKAALDRFASKGACLHLTTASLHVGSPQDMEIYFARQCLLECWLVEHGLPIGLLLPNIPSDVFYDDRMVPVSDNPDWAALCDDAEERLTKRFDLKNGIWMRRPKDHKGDKLSEWPDPASVPGDSPRGFSGPRLDADLHRTVLDSSSSERAGEPKPGAAKALTELYDAGVTVNLSCAGWNPAFRTPEESRARLAALRVQIRDAGIPYDRLVTKDHGDLFFNDKGIQHIDWKSDFKLIKNMLDKNEKARDPLFHVDVPMAV